MSDTVTGASPVGEFSGRATRLWPVVAVLPILVAGSALKPAGVVTLLGLDTTVLSMAILLLATAVEFLRRPGYPVWEMLPVIVFFLIVLMGVAGSDPGDYQSLKTRDFFLVTGVIVVCLPILISGPRDLRGLSVTWVLAGGLASALVISVGGAAAIEGRAGIGEATLGPAYLAAAGVVAAACAWGDRLLPWVASVPLIGVMGGALVAIGSRGPLVGAVAGLVTWVLLKGIWRGRALLAALVASASVLVGLRVASEAASSRILLFEDPARDDLWAIARAAFPTSPVFGLGWGDYSTVSWFFYPHNAFLEVSVELGLVGLLSFVGMLLIAARRVWRNRHRPEVRVIAAVAVVAFVGQQFSSDLTNRVFWIAVVPTLLIERVAHRREIAQSSVAGESSSVRDRSVGSEVRRPPNCATSG